MQWRRHIQRRAVRPADQRVAHGGAHEQTTLWRRRRCPQRSTVRGGWTRWTVLSQQCGTVSNVRSRLIWCVHSGVV